MSTNEISICYMNYCVNTSYFPASINPYSSRVHYPSADTSSIEKVHMDPEKIKVIQGWPPPTTVHEDRQFIELRGFYQQFVEGFQAVAAPSTAMFRADFEWEWTAVHQISCDKLKQAMINATHLSSIDPQEPYHLYTDAWKDCVGATLAQQCAHGKYKGHLPPIAFMSQKMQPAETRTPIREQELLAIVLALKQRCHPL